MPEAVGEFQVRGGGEDPLREAGDVRVAHAHGEQAFSGAIDADGHIDWLMCYRADRTATFVGIQVLDGSIDGRRGTFLLTSIGDHDGKASTGRWEVVAGSGSGALAGIAGEGDWTAGPGPTGSYRLRYELGAG
jgi:uncharacterized protein DUF3224